MLSDLRYALRSLAKTPGFTLIVVLSLALGIGANATVLCWIRHTLWRPIPGITRPEDMTAVLTSFGSSSSDTVSPLDIEDQQKLKEAFAGVIGSQMTPACVTIDGNPEWNYAQITTANYFDVLGVKPVLGRFFLPSEDRAKGKDAVVVISEAWWKRRFAADPGIINRSIIINQHSFTIIGIAPAAFHGTMSGLAFDFWAPVSMHKEVASFGSLRSRDDRWLHTQARLQPGISLAQAQAALDTLAAQLEKAYPRTNHHVGFRILPLWKAPYGGQAILLPVLSILLVVSFGVLLVVCVNVTNLLLVRAIKRQKETAIRLALGASRRRIFQHFLSESLCLSCVGGVLGVLFSFWAIDALVSFFPKTHLPIGYDIKMDPAVLSMVGLLVVGVGMGVGLLPAWQASQKVLQNSLKDGGRGTSGPRHHFIRSFLVASEIALALTLLIGAGLCLKGMKRARQIDVGMNPQGVLLSGLRLGMHGYNEASAKGFYRTLQQRLSSIPGVRSAALCNWFPLGFEGGSVPHVQVKGYVPAPNEDTNVKQGIISPTYFATLEIPFIDGRDFTDHDDVKAPLVAIINQAMAKRFWPDLNPIGRTLRVHGRERTVVGIVKTGRYRSLAEAPQCFFYLPYAQGVWDMDLGLCMKVSGDPLGYVKVLRDTVHSVDPRVEVWTTQRMTDYASAAYVGQEMASTVLMGLGSVALLLASLGVYGVMSFVVGQRTQEFGIRIALGATPGSMIGLVLKQGLFFAATGIVAGLVLSLINAHFMSGFLHGVSPNDFVVFTAMPLIIAAVALLACYLPARRATRVDPVTALRSE